MTTRPFCTGGLTTTVLAGHEGVVSLVPACGGARVCHKGREDSTGSADGSINRAELVEMCPLTMRHLVKRCINGCKSQLSQT